jgi:hypothetical protein
VGIGGFEGFFLTIFDPKMWGYVENQPWRGGPFDPRGF